MHAVADVDLMPVNPLTTLPAAMPRTHLVLNGHAQLEGSAARGRDSKGHMVRHVT